jgi:hypothetical protein
MRWKGPLIGKKMMIQRAFSLKLALIIKNALFIVVNPKSIFLQP